MDSIKHWWQQTKTWQHIALGLGLVVLVFLLVIIGIRINFTNKILPGVNVRGIGLGGMTQAEAEKVLNEKTTQYLNSSISVTGANTATINPSDLGVSFDNHVAAQDAFETGRDADIVTDLANQTLLMLGLYDQDVVQANFDQDKISNFFYDQNNQIASPAQNAHYEITGSDLNVATNTVGQRLDLGQATLSLGEAVSNLKTNIQLPILKINPSQTQDSLVRQKPAVAELTKQPITLTYQDKTWEISRTQLLDWLGAHSDGLPYKTDLLNSYYRIPAQLSDFKLQKGPIVDALKGVAESIDQDPVDAQLTVSGGKAVVFKQSRDGRKLDTEQTANSIIQAITNKQPPTVAMTVNVTKAEVSDDIANLGINELISEGVTYFPGSPSNRLQNVRVGMSKFNGVLLKPNQVFSFGEILGDVGPAQGYAPGLIILGDHEEKAYGGGLCQVSSTAYRAALLAGLPILQRTNHAFAISYYTAPYGVPGVDATIYYPQVDMKFRNDTGHYILIQTEMVGTTLKFRYYGTKTKSGNIRGPFYVTGDSDATKPSQTVFYRDVLDMSGKVVKTDTINTYYQSSLDFPITD